MFSPCKPGHIKRNWAWAPSDWQRPLGNALLDREDWGSHSAEDAALVRNSFYWEIEERFKNELRHEKGDSVLEQFCAGQPEEVGFCHEREVR